LVQRIESSIEHYLKRTVEENAWDAVTYHILVKGSGREED